MRTNTIAVAAVLLLPRVAPAQERHDGAWARQPAGEVIASLQAVPAAQRAAFQAMQSDLRNLVTAQEVFFSDSLSYAGNLSQLHGRFRAREGIAVRVIESNASSWSGQAIHASLPGIICGVYVGQVAIRHPGQLEAMPECWRQTAARTAALSTAPFAGHTAASPTEDRLVVGDTLKFDRPFAANPAGAQVSRYDLPAAQRDLIIAMRFHLTSVMTAQMAFAGDHDRPALNYAEVRSHILSPAPGVQTRIVHASASGWSAQVMHPSLPGIICGIHDRSSMYTHPDQLAGTPTCWQQSSSRN